MNRTINPALLAIALLVSMGGGRASAQEERVDNIGYGTKAGEFLLLPVGGRGTALGQAYTALADDATALYWNPAGLGFLRQGSLSVSHLDYLAGTSYTWAGAAVPLGTGTYAVGVQAAAFNYGDAPVTTVPDPEGTGSTYTNNLFVGGVTFAMNVTDRFSFGLSGKYVRESLANTEGSTFAVDVGTNYHTQAAGRPLRAAFSILNLGGEIQLSGPALGGAVVNPDPSTPDRQDPAELKTLSAALPVMFKVGVAMDAVSSARNRLTLAGEFWQPGQNSTSGALGVEYMLRPEAVGFSLALRGGYTYEPDRSFEDRTGASFDDEGSDGLTFGGGVGYRGSEEGFRLSLDYAFRQMGLLKGTNLFSVSLGW